MTVRQVVLCAVLCGCGGAQKPATDAIRVEVIEAGAAPQVKLVYEPKLHVPERIEVTTKFRLGTSLTNTVLENGRSGMDLPSVAMKIKLEAVSTAGGDAVIECEVEDVAMLDDVSDPKMRARMAKQLPTIKQIHGQWRRSHAGEVVTAESTGTSEPAMADTSCVVRGVRFPDVPIGAGARWRVEKTSRLMGVQWHESTVFTLRQVTGSTAIVDAETTMEAPSQALRVEPRVTTTLKSAFGRGETHLVVPLQRLAPTGDDRRVSRMTLLMTDHSLSIKVENEAEVITLVKALD